ncbi:MAG: hypothetical protein HYV14_11885 [Elusimicrobia bacterium]|nr:hypothetical protein [Elusimicrobiota bacterium]
MKTRALLALALLVLAGASRAQESWAPALPAFAYHTVSARLPEGKLLAAPVVEPGLKLLADHDTAGLGAEAARADAWRKGRAGVTLVESRGAWRLQDASGSALPVSAAFGSALRHMNQYFSLTGPDAPATLSADLKAAFSTPAAIAQVRRAFERSIEERVVVAGKPYTVELGGAIALEPGGINLHYIDDLLRPTLREMIAAGEDPAALARLYAAEPAKMALLDPMGILKSHLARRAQWDAEGRLAPEKRAALLRMTVDTVAESAASHYSGDFGTQLKGMIADDWSGRDGGTWHCHPPDAGPKGWAGDYPPSEADYEAAAKTGQETVVAFTVDGFDVYFLSRPPAGQDAERAEPIFSYRDAGWRRHFQGLFDRLAK